MNRKLLLPIVVLGIAALGAGFLVATQSPLAGRPNPRSFRAVRVVPVETTRVQLDVFSQGTVSPRTESELIPEVSGRVVWTSPALVSGGYFEQGAALLRIASEDYEAGSERARAALARARSEDEHARQVLERRRGLSEREIVSEAALDDALRAARVASANLREARAALEQAGRDLARTEIRAPFSGRVREERVDLGQFLSRGQPFATLYATDLVEVRLPIADAQLAYLELPFWQQAPAAEADLPEVTLSARFAGRDHEWHGRLVRTEGEIDARSRLVHVVARVANDPTKGTFPLPVGLFVQARIAGREREGIVVIPRQSLQGPGRVFVVDGEDRLRFRDVEVLRIQGDEALIERGLEPGERICISPIHTPVDGMRVEPVTTGFDCGSRTG
ncbi:MAG: efflux RND transporter periplasmic adaptor subunit [Myxococcota bacterium]|nr:efflux RND transporter periplasmic adaptor subunit [Myxococcota bacterium]